MSREAYSLLRREAASAGLQAQSADPRVGKILRAVEDDPFCEVEELASRVSLSRSRLSHLFKAATGVSLQTFLSDLRLQRAAELLQSTDMPIKEISYQVGYRHAPSFVRAFRNKVGSSPQDYRSRQRAVLTDSEFG
ncbi:MAG TPA: helix-turn-helix transcriptional regulator [Bryocella sp.]|nr:helix-turn-helix transcriptional regulator [Bryocella sp.]